MKLFHQSQIPITMAHDDLKRQRFIAPGDLQSPIQTVNYVELLPGESFTPHTHPDCEECFYALEGEAEAQVGTEQVKFAKGDFLVVEVGEEHAIKNQTSQIFRYFQFRVIV
jgi:mannose-6-phosphate isomerase-like protein (cupin superfamily)